MLHNSWYRSLSVQSKVLNDIIRIKLLVFLTIFLFVSTLVYDAIFDVVGEFRLLRFILIIPL